MYNRNKMQHAPLHLANLLEGFMSPEANFTDWKNGFGPATNIRETNDQYELFLVAPGLQKEDFKIDVDRNLLSIAYEQKEEHKESNEKWLRLEFKKRAFKRSFNLSEKIDIVHINASYENGILKVQLPKKEKEEAKSLSISVQ